MAKRSGGRRKRSKNRGYWFYKDRGWYTNWKDDGGQRDRRVALYYDGKHLKDPNAKEQAKVAYDQFVKEQEKARRSEKISGVTLLQVCDTYLNHVKRYDHDGTYAIRAPILYDFVTGFPRRFMWNGQEATEADRIHKGYGSLSAMKLTRDDVQDWLDVHDGKEIKRADGTKFKRPKWTRKGGPIAAVLRALNFCASKEAKFLIPENPIKGINNGANKGDLFGERETYFTPEQEEAIYRRANKALAEAVFVCIRTGARSAIEFGSLERRHVEETSQGQIWRFPASEAKGRKKERIIFVPDEVATIVREKIRKFPRGKLFRMLKGSEWTAKSITKAFAELRQRMERDGEPLPEGSVFYSCRHTFAKRMLGGYWGQQVTIEVLAGLMGNTPTVCWRHYAKWSSQYTDPMWSAVNSQKPRIAKVG